MTDPAKRIQVPVLARVEGEGALDISIQDGRIADLQLRIYEPPRLFEKFLEGRDYHEVPDMVARICGICPVAYQMSAVQALEGVFQVEISDWVRDMRRLMYCGEWLQSHSLHIHLLAAPDFLGFGSAIEMAGRFPDEVRRGLALQTLGNDIISLLGGRSVHPVGVRVGGFHRAPARAGMVAIHSRLVAAEELALALLDWCAHLEFPHSRQSFVRMSMVDAAQYPMCSGHLATSSGLAFDKAGFLQHVREYQVPYSTALHAHLHGEPYLVGPLARLQLNRGVLPGVARDALENLPVELAYDNAHASMLARAVEILVAISEARRLSADYEPPATPHADVEPAAGVGYGCTEAPRGLLWHRYETDAEGRILAADIVPPTSQNQARMESDLRQTLEDYGLDQAEDELRALAERTVRNYDPCISCATHFLRLRVRQAAS